MSDQDTFGRLVDVPARQAWAHEALGFTPWLADNLDRLSEAIGIPLELTGREVGVGRYSADIIARNPIDDEIVLIENQLEWSDHTHLGQLLTYLAGTTAKVVIWLAPAFREEHLSAIRWLNQHSQEEFSFFAVRLRVVQIGSSPLAPLFEALEKPNSWDKRLQQSVKASAEPSAQAAGRRAFWERYAQIHPAIQADAVAGGGVARWRAIGDTGIMVSRYKAKDKVGLFLRGGRGVDGHAILPLLTPHQAALEAALGVELGEPGYPFDKWGPTVSDDSASWDAAIDWLESETVRFVDAVQTAFEGAPA
jgi:hypothetical protein